MSCGGVGPEGAAAETMGFLDIRAEIGDLEGGFARASEFGVMILTCPECATGYFVDDAQLRPGGRAVRCAACGARWTARATRDRWSRQFTRGRRPRQGAARGLRRRRAAHRRRPAQGLPLPRRGREAHAPGGGLRGRLGRSGGRAGRHRRRGGDLSRRTWSASGPGAPRPMRRWGCR